MKTIAVGVEFVVRMILFAAMLGVLASQQREHRRLARIPARVRH